MERGRQGRQLVFVIEISPHMTPFDPHAWAVLWSAVTLTNLSTSAAYRLWVIPVSTRTDCSMPRPSAASDASDISENRERKTDTPVVTLCQQWFSCVCSEYTLILRGHWEALADSCQMPGGSYSGLNISGPQIYIVDKEKWRKVKAVFE